MKLSEYSSETFNYRRSAGSVGSSPSASVFPMRRTRSEDRYHRRTRWSWRNHGPLDTEYPWAIPFTSAVISLIREYLTSPSITGEASDRIFSLVLRHLVPSGIWSHFLFQSPSARVQCFADWLEEPTSNTHDLEQSRGAAATRSR